LKDAPVFGRDCGAALMRQPDFHAGQLPQQSSELLEDAIAGRAQAGIMRPQIHAFVLSQGFARVLKNVLLLNTSRTLQPQVNEGG
jgi:hypothetical protein